MSYSSCQAYIQPFTPTEFLETKPINKETKEVEHLTEEIYSILRAKSKQGDFAETPYIVQGREVGYKYAFYFNLPSSMTQNVLRKAINAINNLGWIVQYSMPRCPNAPISFTVYYCEIKDWAKEWVKKVRAEETEGTEEKLEEGFQ